MRERHLDFVPTARGLHIFRSCSESSGHVASFFVQIPGDLAGDSVRALRFEFADVAIQFAGAIDARSFRCDTAPGSRVGPTELNQFFASSC